MQHQLGSIEARIPMCLLVEGTSGLTLIAALRYESQDPYAIRATFTAGDTSVTWILARDLLQQGLVDASGDGDVRVWPELDEDEQPAVMIRLSSPDGIAVLSVEADLMQQFLHRTFAVVPGGEEWRHLDLDACLDHLLSRP